MKPFEKQFMKAKTLTLRSGFYWGHKSSWDIQPSIGWFTLYFNYAETLYTMVAS